MVGDRLFQKQSVIVSLIFTKLLLNAFQYYCREASKNVSICNCSGISMIHLNDIIMVETDCYVGTIEKI